MEVEIERAKTLNVLSIDTINEGNGPHSYSQKSSFRAIHRYTSQVEHECLKNGCI